jgi:hypothetical protein
MIVSSDHIQSTGTEIGKAKNKTLVMLASCLSLSIIVIAILFSPNKFIYDESFFIQYVNLLKAHGFSKEFMNSLPGAPGPLVAIVQGLAEPLTSLNPIKMRLINFSIFLIILAIIRRITAKKGYFLIALTALSIPMAWCIAGMALSEIPAMLFVSVALFFLFKAIRVHRETSYCPLLLIAFSALCLAVAVWGRQPYALLAGLPLLLAIWDRTLTRIAIVYSFIVALCSLPLLLIWKGLVPPSMQTGFQGLVFRHLVLSLGYTAMCILIIAPQLISLRVRYLGGMLILSIVLVYCFSGLAQQIPSRSIIEAHFSSGFVRAYGFAWGTAFVLLGSIFAFSVIRAIIHAKTPEELIISSGLLVCSVAPLFIAGQYSSRYSGMALPFMVLYAIEAEHKDSYRFPLLTLGNFLGFISLLNYFVYS